MDSQKLQQVNNDNILIKNAKVDGKKSSKFSFPKNLKNELISKSQKIKNVVLGKTFSQSINASFFKKMLKDGWFFLVASFFSGFFPIITCLVSSAIPHQGGQVIMGIGLLTSFQIIFNNVGFATALAMVLALVKLTQTRNKDRGFVNEAGLVVAQFVINIFIGVFMTGLSVGLSIGYASYNCGRPNMELVKVEAMHYILTTIPTILLNSWTSVVLLAVFKNKGNTIAVILIVLQNAMGAGLISIFAFCTNLSATGIGIGYDIANVFALLISIITAMTGANRYKFRELKFKWNDLVFLVKSTFKTGIVVAWRVSVRGIVVIVLSIVSARITHVIPVNIVFGKILWFNMNFFLPWFGNGLANALKYSTVKNPINYEYNDIKPFVTFIVISVLINILTSIVWFATLPEIINQYIANFQDMRIFAIQHIYNPINPDINSKFEYAYNCWAQTGSLQKNLPINEQITGVPSWVNDPEYSKYLSPINNNPQLLGQLYWVNATTFGSYKDCDCSIFTLFWGEQCWHGTPSAYAPFYTTTILFIIIYHMVVILDSLFTQITSLFTKKSRSFLTSILLHTAIMMTVMLFGYFETPLMGIEAFVLPFFVFTGIMALRSGYIFTKVCNQYRIKYYSENLTVKPAKWFVKWQNFKKTKFAKFWRNLWIPFKWLQNAFSKVCKFIFTVILNKKWIMKAFNIHPSNKNKTVQKDISNDIDNTSLVKEYNKADNEPIVLFNKNNIKDSTMNENDRKVFGQVNKTIISSKEYYSSLSPHDDHSHRHKRVKINLNDVVSIKNLPNDTKVNYPTNIPEITLAPGESISSFDDTIKHTLKK